MFQLHPTCTTSLDKIVWSLLVQKQNSFTMSLYNFPQRFAKVYWDCEIKWTINMHYSVSSSNWATTMSGSRTRRLENAKWDLNWSVVQLTILLRIRTLTGRPKPERTQNSHYIYTYIYLYKTPAWKMTNIEVWGAYTVIGYGSKG